MGSSKYWSRKKWYRVPRKNRTGFRGDRLPQPYAGNPEESEASSIVSTHTVRPIRVLACLTSLTFLSFSLLPPAACAQLQFVQQLPTVAGPHAVTSTGAIPLTYDANVSLILRHAYIFSLTEEGRPARLTPAVLLCDPSITRNLPSPQSA